MKIFPQFGKSPRGDRKQRISNSPNYKNGSFQNLEASSMMNKGASFSLVKILKAYMKSTSKNRRPISSIKSIKTDLKNLDDNCVVRFGHSSYMLKIDGYNILIDPVFSTYASPFRYFGPKAFDGTDIYNTDDLPDIDLLIITHDHYDHMDYRTLQNMKNKVKNVVTGLGVGEHLEYWGYDSGKIVEMDRYDSENIHEDMKVICTPARHFSGRGLIRNKTLRCSFVLQIGSHNIYIGGDSGYGSHFRYIGDTYGKFDLAILECGQYNEMRSDIHTMPDMMPKVIEDINATKVIPVHWGKFSLALHDRDDPINNLQKKELHNVDIITPHLGDKIYI